MEVLNILNELMKRERISNMEFVLPVGLVKKETGGYLVRSRLLPLYLFDDTSFESRFGEKFLYSDKKSKSEEGLVNIGKGWNPCSVLDFNFETRKIVVLLADKKISLPRINVFFIKESPKGFIWRVRRCLLLRKQALTHLYRCCFLNSMPADKSPIRASTERILQLAITTSTKKYCKVVNKVKLNREIRQLLGRFENYLKFELLGKKYYQAKKENVKKLSSDLLTFEIYARPIIRIYRENSRIPNFFQGEERTHLNANYHNFGQVWTTYGSSILFNEQKRSFMFKSLLTQSAVILSQQKVKEHCNNMLQWELFNLNITEALRPNEFGALQDNVLQVINRQMKEKWISEIRNGIKQDFRDVGKGWYSIKESSLEVYSFSKLKRFFHVVNLQMQTSLQNFLLTNINNYEKFLRQSCEQNKDVFIVELLVEERVIDETVESDFRLKEAFELTEGVYRYFNYNPRLKVIQKVILQSLNNAINSLQDLPQVEKQVMNLLFWATEPKIRCISRREQLLQKFLADIEEDIYTNLLTVRRYLKKFVPYEKFINKSVGLQVEQYEVEHSLEVEENDEDNISKDILEKVEPLDPFGCYNSILFHLQEAREIDQSIPTEVVLSCVRASCTRVKKYLCQKHLDIAFALETLLKKQIFNRNTLLLEEFQYIETQLGQRVQNVEEVTALDEYISQLPGRLSSLAKDISGLQDTFDVLTKLKHEFSALESEERFAVLFFPGKLRKLIREVMENNMELRKSFLDDQIREQQSFKKKVLSVSKDVEEISSIVSLEKLFSARPKCVKLRKRMQDLIDSARRFNSRESLFELPLTNYDEVSDLNKEFETYEAFWNTTHYWRENIEHWRYTPFRDLAASLLEEKVEQYFKEIIRVGKIFSKNGETDLEEASSIVKAEIDDFRPLVPIVSALRQPGLQQRHWEQLNDLLSLDKALNPHDESFTLSELMGERFDLLEDNPISVKRREDICMVGEIAQKEHSLELGLDAMKADWAEVLLDLTPYKDTGTCILRGVDELNQVIDEQVTIAQGMLFSNFKGPFENDIVDYNEDLVTMSEVLEEWLVLQRNWMYLQPIFDSEDINKQLPTEGKRFSQVSNTWRNIISSGLKKRKAFIFCKDKKLLGRFKECNQLLDLVSKGLSDYLETKRGGFARFYFLSNDELLEILSQTKDPTMVQGHLKKCFEGIKRVKFSEHKNPIITEMRSGEGEVIQLADVVNPTSRNVEDWMTELDIQMKLSVKKELLHSILSYLELKRTDWIQVVPGQCAINGSQLHWTRLIETKLDESGSKGISECCGIQVHQIEDMVKLVRKKDLQRLARITLSALTVIDVHARDVTFQLKEGGVTDKEEFLWISQMRFYWGMDEGVDIATLSEEGDMSVQMVSSNRPYGYEYLGNSFRLVITPLTDKCYLTLMGALQMILGGAPAGPAGTGKTETTKDLAKALAKQCVVFNCSDGLDYLAMGKFFKGLASCGAWACFDEFNRIDVEVLSVVAQQIMTLQNAAKRKLTKVEFEGSIIAMNDQFAVYITMNPGYAGRTELPDNLKALFRPVAMMVPDYGLIGEIMLYSFGYSKARKCAKKMVATFRLCSEQLSAQDHYDYGMRAVKTTIVAAGNLKRAEPDTEEEILLLRALQDVNFPKFLSHDLPLFRGIISDLFPGLERPYIDYGELSLCIKLICEHNNLQCVEFFMKKVIQLYETVVVRHGLMLVGPSGGGKSRNVETLDETLSLLKKRECSGFAFEKVQRYSLNPKSITMGQLYGEFDPNTHEWQDGILAFIVRNCAKQANPDRKWVMFDGPVDAIWIENMNTVLDDNKKLCLNSGEIIGLSDEMTMMFEVEDLAVASPATVSRVGIVYMEPATLGLDVVQESWLNSLPEVFERYTLEGEKKTSKNSNISCLTFLKKSLRHLFDSYVSNTIAFLRRNFKEPVITCDNNLNSSMLKLLDCFLAEFQLLDGVKEKDLVPRIVKFCTEDFPSYFIFSLIWSLCATVGSIERKILDGFLRKLMFSNCFEPSLPLDGLVYEYLWGHPFLATNKDGAEGTLSSKTWVKWLDSTKSYEYDPSLNFTETIIPTTDSVCYSYLAKTLYISKKHFIMAGATGTGKSSNINTLLGSGLSSVFIPLCINFSAQTSANQTQDFIDSKLEKLKKGVFGPQLGKHFLCFIDDLNMPKKEEYFAQPPIELVRQLFNYEGWYDRKLLQFRKIINFSVIGALGHPGGGRNTITMRIKRYFNLINYTKMERESMQKIYNTILQNFLRDGPMDLGELTSLIVTSSINIFYKISDELLPTPEKSHYMYNMRDLGKVFQGILLCSKRALTSESLLIRIWCHEVTRVFGDRLINDDDRNWFDSRILEEIGRTMKLGVAELAQIQGDQATIIYCDFLNPTGDKVYEQACNIEGLVPLVEEYLLEYNSECHQPMPLVIFFDAIMYITRIDRVLIQQLGNCLLLGVGGSGRQSLTKLASFICNYQCFQIEISKNYGLVEWREDVKKCLLSAGIENKPVTFLFVDSQIIDEQMLEDLNGVLNAGDIPNIYAPDDLEKIMSTCRIDCQKKGIQPTKMNVFAQYLLRVKSNIHLVLCMSPGTPVFRDRLRMFPSLINCCTIVWFSEWPDEALRSVGRGVLLESGLDLGNQSDNVVELFKVFHQSVAKASVDYMNNLRRYNYVTPTSFLELLNIFKSLMNKKKKEIDLSVSRLQVGLDKLQSTSKMVASLQIDLTEMQPQLEKTQKEVGEMIIQINKDKEAAKKTEDRVKVEEAEAEKKAKETKDIADDAQRDLDAALPALDEAVACLNKLKKADLDEVKSLKTPPKGVKLTIEAACIMFNIKPIMVKDPNKLGAKLKDYWAAAQKTLLVDAKQLLADLMSFDKDNISDKTISEIEPYIQMDDFTPAIIEKASKACTAICMWVRAMHTYNGVAKNVEPKKKLLEEAQEQLEITMKSLENARNTLEQVKNKIRTLEEDFESSNKKKQALEDEAYLCSGRLERAHKLMSGLGGEKARWEETVALLKKQINCLTGDILLSSGSTAYLGPFTSQFRHSLTKDWLKRLADLNIPHSADTNIVEILGDPVKIRQWNVFGLPNDEHSTENGIFMSESRRWPLLVDPQNQANRFIKSMGKDRRLCANGLEVVKQSDKNLLRILENGIRFGRWVLLENVGEKLDASLEPVLLRQTFEQGNQLLIRLGESNIPYHSDFNFFMTTKLPNPHYQPEIFVKVSLLNFNITPKGLEEQLLGVIMQNELPEMEAKRNELVINNARMAQELKGIEDTILHMLSSSQGNILDDQELIDTLSTSKVKSNSINARVAEAKITQSEINEERERYRAVAFRGSILFFCIADLRAIDPMYEYSLQWFTQLFTQGILNSEKAEDGKVQRRLEILNDFITYSIYSSVCRSLFERHKLLFSFSLITRILQGRDLVNPEEWRFLLSGQVTREKNKDQNFNKPNWCPDRTWNELCILSGLPAFENILYFLGEGSMEAEWEAFYGSDTCYRDQWPADARHDWNSSFSPLQKLCLLRCFRPDKMIPAIQLFIVTDEVYGQRFIEPPPFDISNSFAGSNVITPLIFVLTSGTDPTKDFMQFAEQMGRKVNAISLGQGQGPLAEKQVEVGCDTGCWVLLQNCHLASSWMPKLEKIVEELDPTTVHRDFRLWLTSMPSKNFPVSVLQQSVKLVKEPPSGLRSNLKSAYYNLTNEAINVTNKPEVFRKLIFGLCFFHALIQERRKFGPLGWNIPYEFNETDLEISIRQLELYINKYEEPPYEVVNILTSYINYGGRVTDAIDNRTIDIILRQFYCPEALVPGYNYSASGIYHTIQTDRDLSYTQYLEYIESLPVNAEPEVFGMHENASITCALAETYDLFDTLLLLQPKSGSGAGQSMEEVVDILATKIITQLPRIFNLESIAMEYPVKYEESMNTVLVQEAGRYQKLLIEVKKTLFDLGKALKGLVVLSSELENMANSMFAQKVPSLWEAKAYPSLKPLNAWVDEFLQRLNFISEWVRHGNPSVYWISGFFFPQAFLTGQMQNFARAKQYPIDTISFDTQYMKAPMDNLTEGPSCGCYVHGLFLEGAKWDYERMELCNSDAKVLYTKLPVTHFLPVKDLKPRVEGVYRCPIYKVLSRRGTLSTTGHSTNFVMWVDVPGTGTNIKNNRGLSDIKEWIKAGVAAFCSLKY
eukprot:maker-scaffold_7-snap-gene-19.73-mRNA-1 protein AED:0.01 eAED:0.01 QI:0/0/0/1/1/1/2/0/4142